MTAEQKQAVKKILADAGVTLTNYGVVGLPNNEAECRKVFDFAKEMGIENIVSEPPADAFRSDRQALPGVQDRRGDSQPSQAVALLEL